MGFRGKSTNSAGTRWMQVRVWHSLPLFYATSWGAGGEDIILMPLKLRTQANADFSLKRAEITPKDYAVYSLKFQEFFF